MNTAFYYDIVCPYAYMAFSLLHRSQAFQRKGIELKPILLGGLFKELGYQSSPHQSMSTRKADYTRKDIERQAEFFTLPLKYPKTHPQSTVSAMRLLAACEASKRADLTQALYSAYWQEERAMDDGLLEEIAKKFSIARSPAYSDLAKEALFLNTKEAFSKDVFGVPTIAHHERLYFGADRLYLLKRELELELPDPPWRADQEPIDFYFDFSSPYSYLAWAEVKRAQAMGVRFNLIPVLLGAIFKEIGLIDIPLLSAHPTKTAYFLQDMKDWALHRGCPFSFSPHFPLRSVTALRLAVADNKTIDSIFTKAWGHEQNISEEAVLAQILKEGGFDEQALLKRATDDDIKDTLKKNTGTALSRGVFGVPTFFVGSAMVFGQDRFPWIKHCKP